MFELLGIKLSVEEFDHLLCEQSSGKELKVVNGKVVAVTHEPSAKELAERKIMELKAKLSDTDYKAVKHSEGLISDADYKPIKEQRQAWRDEINKLESEL